MRLLPQDVGARWTDVRSIGMRRGHSPRTGGCQAPGPRQLVLLVSAFRCCGEVFGPSEFCEAAGRKNAGKRIIGQITCSCCEPHTCSLMSPLAASELPSTYRDAAIFSNTYEKDDPTTKLINEVEISIIHPAVTRIGSDGSSAFGVVWILKIACFHPNHTHLHNHCLRGSAQLFKGEKC